MTDDELEQIAEDSLLFWAVSCIAFFCILRLLRRAALSIHLRMP